MRLKRSAVAATVALLLLGSCGTANERSAASQFGPVVSSIDAIVGTELSATEVVPLPCIPSRSDPVGVWLGVRIHAAGITGGAYIIELQQTQARLGSHPSGCRNPQVLLANSVFLVGDSEPIFASTASTSGDVTTLMFQLDAPTARGLDIVVLPTIEFEKKDGTLETSIFGLIGRYSLN